MKNLSFAGKVQVLRVHKIPVLNAAVCVGGWESILMYLAVLKCADGFLECF